MARLPVPATSPAAATADAPAESTPPTADAGAGTPPDTADDEPEASTEVRILLDQGDWRPNDVALLTPAELRAGLAAGWADDDPAAVAYAKSLTL